MNTKHIGVITAGAWGTALGKVLADNGHPVQMATSRKSLVKEINQTHQNSRYLRGVRLPKNLKASCNLKEVVTNKDALLLVTPSLYLMNTLETIAPWIENTNIPIALLTKGFVPTDHEPMLMVDAVAKRLPEYRKKHLAYISGPAQAEEVARGKITGLISASNHGKTAIFFRDLLSQDPLMVFPSLDVVGVQTCGAVKNVIAIAFGVLDALKSFSDRFGDNTESLLLAAGLNEIQQLGMTLGATHAETFSSIAGVGDLDVTCRSPYGRNRRFGREIILNHILKKYNSIQDVLDHIDDFGYLPEGVAASYYVEQLRQKHDLALPICQGVFDVLNCQQDPSDAVEQMLQNTARKQ